MTEPIDKLDTLLIADDEANILNALSRLFRRDGYRLLQASTGQEALKLLAENEVGVILSDQRMPDMSGVEFLRKARENWPDSVRIILSGYTELASVTDSVNRAAIYKFLTKPWDDEALRETVRKAFHLYHVTRENTRLNAELKQSNEALTHLNQELEQRVAIKTQEAMRNLKSLRASQEILAKLPIPVLGIDPDGYLVMLNQAAQSMLGISSAFLGDLATEVIPAGFLGGSLSDEGVGQGCLADGRAAQYWRYPLGTGSAEMGTALVIHNIEPGSRQ